MSGLGSPGPYCEPFVGGANVMAAMPADAGPRLAGDIDHELIALWQAAVKGWVPPTLVSEVEYNQAKNDNQLAPEFRAFCRYGISWGGKPFSGYARDPRSGRNYAEVASRSVLKKAAKMADVRFVAQSYDAWAPSGWLVYCDPPYQGTTSYTGTPKFDHDRFWSVMRRWSMTNTVVISEYRAPDDFRCVLELPHVRGLDSKRVTERLFMYAPTVANDNQ